MEFEDINVKCFDNFTADNNRELEKKLFKSIFRIVNNLIEPVEAMICKDLSSD